MTPYRVEFEILLPDNLRNDDVFEWLEFELHTGDSSMACRNPLAGHELKAEPNTVQVDTTWRAEE